MRYVDKIIFRGNETYKRFYQGNQLLFEIKQPEPVEWDGFYFEAVDGNAIVEYYPMNNDIVDWDNQTVRLYYSINNPDFINFYPVDNLHHTFDLNEGDKIYFYGVYDYAISGEGIPITETTYSHFQIKYGNVNVGGDINTLHYGYLCDDYYGTYSNYEWHSLFRYSNIVDASKLIIGKNASIDDAYNSMANNTCQFMFADCHTLIAAPQLNSRHLDYECFYYMFSNCTSLTTAPELPAIYLSLFSYNFMFYGCSKLNYIKAMFLTNPTTNNVGYWLYGVAATGTFVKNKDATWDVRGVSGIPDGWVVETA